MIRLFMAILFSTLFFLPAFSAEPEQTPILKDEIDDINYSFGHQLGTELLENSIEFRPDALWQGLYDANVDAEPELSLETMLHLINQIRLGELSADDPQAFRLKGQEFLANNSKEEAIKTLTSGLQYKVMKIGGGKNPASTDSVLVNYRARTIEGQEFDNTYPLDIETPVELKVNKLLPGLTEGLQLMKEGDKWEIYLPANLAYKDSGPMAGQTVIYELELLEILPEYR
jgi:FKBP-type peptidyl-prolyl cis-trans isomerase FklB